MSTLLPAHIRHLQAAGRSPRTIGDRQRVLQAADRSPSLPYGIDQASTDELAAWLSNPRWSAWTRCTYHRHIAGFYRWATDPAHPRLTFDPAAVLVAPRSPDADPKPVTDQELATALARSSDWWQLVIALGAYGGLRASEMAGLRREDVTQAAITIAGKGNRTKQVPTHPEIWARVRDAGPGSLLGLRGRAMHKHLPGLARRHFDHIGLPDVHLHRFRHWYATALLMGGADIVTVRDLMRHKSIKTTEAYLGIVDGQRRLAISTLPVPSSPQLGAA